MSDLSRTIGYLAQVACTWEVLARKAGNVCPGREFPDLTVNDFLRSAAAIAPIMEEAPHQPLGATILRAIEATRRVVNTNTNLGIVLLLAPLCAVPLDEPLRPGLRRILESTTVEDSRNVYTAIRLARPSGLGEANEQDVRDEPTLPLREVMALAMDRDLIAWQYSNAFQTALWLGHEFGACIRHFRTVEELVVVIHLLALFSFTDSLIARKVGMDEARNVKRKVAPILNAINTVQGRRAFCDFDAFLRSERHARNPGTTADLIAAGLYVALRENLIPLTMPFVWDDHPFQFASDAEAQAM